MKSLRARLLVLLLATVLLAWIATAVFSYFDVRHEINEMLDAHLAQSASLLVAQSGGELREPAREDAERVHKYEREVAFQIWERGQLRMRSASAPGVHLSRVPEGFSNSVIDGRRWRVFSRLDEEGRYVVQVGEVYKFREELAASVAGHLMHPLAVALPALAVLIWLGTAWGLAPLKRLARDVARRAPDNLAPLNSAGAPDEVVPLLGALNALFSRLRASLEKERRFTADAAHELRTPLAAIKTQAQVAQAARSGEERERALRNVASGVDRTTRLVEQLLALARLDPGAAAMERRVVDLVQLASESLKDIAPEAASKRIELGLEGETGVTVSGDARLLHLLLRNLLDNAVRYTPAGGSVSVRVERRGAGVALLVTDTGPGIAPAERARVTERFYRVLGSGEEGSGLGLSIVSQVAELHGATLALHAADGASGLRAEVMFPAQAAPLNAYPAKVATS